MKLLSVNTAVLALLVLGVAGMVVPTGAVMDGPSDQVWDEPAISLAPAPGPNGQYAQIGPDGNLTVDVSDVNVNSVSTVREVITVTNNESVPYEIWVSHDGGEAVQFFVAGSRSLDDSGNPVVLEAGETRPVSLVIDTRNRSANEVLMSELTLHAQRVSTPTPTPTETSSDSGSGGSGSDSTATATPAATETPPPTDEESVVVTFGVETGGQSDAGVTVREMTVAELDEDPDAMPRAVIDRSETAIDVSTGQPTVMRANGYDTVAEVGEPVSLSGSRSLIGQVTGVDSQERIVKLVDIQVPEERRDQPGTVRITVARGKFGTTDPSEATIAHRTDGGWQLLDTQVTNRAERTITLEAETPGFSPFAVFVTNQVEYTWTLPDGTVFDGQQVRSAFDEPGRYNVTLTVTDAFDRSDSAVHRILVNDRPTVAIEGLENASDDGPTTLRANVTNEFGNVTVTWTFADGSTTTGETVTRSLEPGETVRVIVEDEYGAEGQAEGVAGRAAGDTGPPSIGLVHFNLGLQARLAIVGVAVILLVVGLRWLAARRYDLR